MNTPPIIENGLIILRPPVKADIAARLSLGLNTECIRMCGGDINKKEFTHCDAEVWLDGIMRHPCKWVIEFSGNCIGIAGLRPYMSDNKARYSIEIYDGNFYGRGIGSEVTRMILKYAFSVRDYHKVYLRVLEFNTRAIRCYEKSGFKKEGTDREGALIDGNYCSDIYMGILKSEYINE